MQRRHRDQLAIFTRAQHGLVARSQAMDAIGERALEFFLSEGVDELELVAPGVYRFTRDFRPKHQDIVAAMISHTSPERVSLLQSRSSPIVAARESAAAILDVGKFGLERHVLISASPIDPVGDVIVTVQELRPEDVWMVDRIPVTCPARLIEDLVANHYPGDEVGAVLSDSLRKGLVSLERVQERLEGYGADYGIPDDAGPKLANFFLEVAAHEFDPHQSADAPPLAI